MRAGCRRANNLEELAIAWLEGNETPKPQRKIIEHASGKRDVNEHDLSKGLSALITILRSDQPLSATRPEAGALW